MMMRLIISSLFSGMLMARVRMIKHTKHLLARDLGITFRNRSLASARIEGLQAYTGSSSRWGCLQSAEMSGSYWEVQSNIVQNWLVICPGEKTSDRTLIIHGESGMCLNRQSLKVMEWSVCRTSDLATAALFGGLLDLHVQKQIEHDIT